MKTAETKSASHQQPNTAAKSFFNQEQEQAFFSETSSDRSSFFPSTASNPIQFKPTVGETPFFSPSPATVQAKCATCEAKEQSQLGAESSTESPRIQRTPGFESEGAVQAKATPDAKAIAPPPANPKSQPNSDTKELEQQDAIADTPQIQMMPAFSSSDDTGDGDDPNAEKPPVQFSLAISQPGDAYEREADAMADRVAALSRERAAAAPETLALSQPQQLNRKPESLMMQSDATVDWVAAMKKSPLGVAPKTLTSSQPQQLNRKPESLMMQSNGNPSIAPKHLESRLQQAKGSGTPLDADTRTEMEEAFSSDFSGVQIHTGQEAASLNQSLGARAFTHGNNIFFNKGEYQPESAQGKHLLAHELTHTIQQGHGVQRKVAASPSIQARQTTPDLQRVPDAPGNQPTVSSEVVDITTSPFKPSDKVKGEIEAQGNKGLDVRTIIKGVTSEGRVKVKLNRQGNYDSIRQGSMPLLNDWAKQLGGMYVNFIVKNSEITEGYASLKEKGGDTNDWLQALKKNSSALGGLGLKVENLPTPVNKLENGKLTLGVNDLKVEVGGFVDAQFNLLLENANKPKIDATANINVKGVAQGVLKLDNTQEKLTGEVGLGINLKAFSGEAKVKYNGDGTVDIGGKATYNANKLSGEIQFVATDLETANRFGRDSIAAAGGKENVQDAPPPAPVPPAKSNQKQRALAATGQLGFNLTTWFVGTVNVVVDGNGNITVIGRITPPAEIELFPQRNWEKEIITLEARAYYGIPVVGNLNVFANIGLYAIAMLGPAKIYNIEVLGTYSTDPEIQRSIQISGSINISAYAGLRLRAEGGAGIELVDHDLRFGVGLNADVGVKAYADARPTIGYRDPGVFYISGVLEMVAQPMLGLSGDFFIELDSPWWSPAPDKKWIWPLFSKEWPLTDPIGISAALKDYELGSGKVPEVELKKPEFDPSKFMTNMVDNKLPSKSGGKATGQGTFKEDGSVPSPEVKPKKAESKTTGAKPTSKGTPPPLGKSARPDPEAEKAKDSMKLLADASQQTKALKAKEPFTKADLIKELNNIEGQIRGVDFSFKPKDDVWTITPRVGAKTGKKLEVGKKGSITSDKSTEEDRKVGLAAFEKEEQKYLKQNTISKENAQKVAKTVKHNHSVFKSINVIDGKDSWNYQYVFRMAVDTPATKAKLNKDEALEEAKKDPRLQQPKFPKTIFYDVLVEVSGVSRRQTVRDWATSYISDGLLFETDISDPSDPQAKFTFDRNLAGATRTATRRATATPFERSRNYVPVARAFGLAEPNLTATSSEADLQNYYQNLRRQIINKYKDKRFSEFKSEVLNHSAVKISDLNRWSEQLASEYLQTLNLAPSGTYTFKKTGNMTKKRTSDSYEEATATLIERKTHRTAQSPNSEEISQMKDYNLILTIPVPGERRTADGKDVNEKEFTKIRYVFFNADMLSLWERILDREIPGKFETQVQSD